MHCNPCASLTLRIMRLGFSRNEAEEITRSVLTGIVVVMTIMSCTIRRRGCRPLPEDEECTPSDDGGIHAGIAGSQGSGLVIAVVDARTSTPASFPVPVRVPA